MPDKNTDVVMVHAVLVDIDGICGSLKVTAPGSVTVKAGQKLTIYEPNTIIDQTSYKRY